MTHRCIAMMAALTVMTTAATARAQAPEEKATGAVAVRQAAMQAQGGHTTAIQKILTEQPDLLSHVAVHAQAVAATSPLIPAMFPEGSTQASDALPAVWSDKAGFEAAAKRNQELAQQLAQTAEGGDPKATLAAFAALGRQGCGGCHQTYRVKKS